MSMDIVQDPVAMQQIALQLHRNGKRIGLVPTMGFLHEGHISLMRQLRPQVDRLLVSLFVNPTQFGPGEDLDRYPRDLERDRELCAQVPVDILFLPDREAIYPSGYASYVDFERYSDQLCGATRPGHFRGVGTVVLKMLQLCQPDLAAFGRKDAQQLFLIKQMVRDFNLPVRIVEGITVREADGVAMSSRNSYLNQEERLQATALSRMLHSIQESVAAGERETARLRELGMALLVDYPLFQLEYLELRSWHDLSQQDIVAFPLLVAIAGRIGKTRLIDNIILSDLKDAAGSPIIPDQQNRESS